MCRLNQISKVLKFRTSAYIYISDSLSFNEVLWGGAHVRSSGCALATRSACRVPRTASKASTPFPHKYQPQQNSWFSNRRLNGRKEDINKTTENSSLNKKIRIRNNNITKIRITKIWDSFFWSRSGGLTLSNASRSHAKHPA